MIYRFYEVETLVQGEKQWPMRKINQTVGYAIENSGLESLLLAQTGGAPFGKIRAETS